MGDAAISDRSRAEANTRGELVDLLHRSLSLSIMSQQTNPRLSADAAADRVQATHDEVLALLTEAENLGDANITRWF